MTDTRFSRLSNIDPADQATWEGKIFFTFDIDWSLDARSILRLVNACAKPYAGAFCYFENETIIVWDTRLAPNENYLAIPGQVTSLSDDYVEVATFKRKLRLCDLEKNGASIQPRQLCSSVRQRFS